MIHTQVTATPPSPHASVLKQRFLCAPASSYVIAPHIPLSRRVVNKGRHVVQWSTCRRSRGREQPWLLFPFFYGILFTRLLWWRIIFESICPPPIPRKSYLCTHSESPICTQRKQPYETLETLCFPPPLAGSILNLRLTLFIGRTPILGTKNINIDSVNRSLKETLALFYWLLMAVQIWSCFQNY